MMCTYCRVLDWADDDYKCHKIRVEPKGLYTYIRTYSRMILSYIGTTNYVLSCTDHEFVHCERVIEANCWIGVCTCWCCVYG